MVWFLTLPACHEASFRQDVVQAGGRVDLVYRFSGADGDTVCVDVDGGGGVQSVIDSYRYLGLAGI